MSASLPAAPGGAEDSLPRGRAARAEEWLLAAALAAMTILPLLPIPLRALLHVQIKGQTAIVQHLTLVVAMLGAAIAARDGRLLSLAAVGLLPRGRWLAAGKLFAAAVAAAVGAWLCVAGVRFVLAERAAGAPLAYGVPAWVVQLVLPAGFALVAIRIVWTASGAWPARAAALLLAALLILATAQGALPPARLALPALVVLFLATILGAPVFALLGGAALILFWRDGSPIASLTVDHYGLVTNATLPSVPLFTLAGCILAEGGAAGRLIRLFRAAVGGVRGGAAILVALACAFFTSFTGASGVTILALGALLMPVLLGAGFSQRTALGLLTGAGSLGLLLPPCLPLILYGVVASVDIRSMFLAGIAPGLLLTALVAAWGVGRAPAATGAWRIDWRATWLALLDAKWELLLPVVALGGLLSGLATPVEASALTAFYAFVVEVFVYRDMKLLRRAPKVMASTGALVGSVLLILGVALGLSNYLAFAEVPAHAVAWVTATVHSKWAFLLMVNLFLLAVGMLMDIFSAIMVIAPLLVPLGHAFGVAPVHLGIVFLANLELGYLTPPVGVNLFLSSLRFGRPMSAVFRASLPMLIVLLVGVLMITYIPALTTTLPGWLGPRSTVAPAP